MPGWIRAFPGHGERSPGCLPRRSTDRDRVRDDAFSVAVEQHPLRHIDDDFAGHDRGWNDVTVVDQKHPARFERPVGSQTVVGRDGGRINTETGRKTRQRLPRGHDMRRDPAGDDLRFTCWTVDRVYENAREDEGRNAEPRKHDTLN